MINWAKQKKGTYRMELMRKVTASKLPEARKHERPILLQVTFG